MILHNWDELVEIEQLLSRWMLKDDICKYFDVKSIWEQKLRGVEREKCVPWIVVKGNFYRLGNGAVGEWWRVHYGQRSSMFWFQWTLLVVDVLINREDLRLKRI